MERPKRKVGFTRMVAAAARSSLKRYPAHIAESVSQRKRRAAGEKLGSGTAAEVLPREARLAAAWLGHASVMLHVGGVRGITVLTDPVFSERIGPRMGRQTVGMRRLAAAPILPEAPIDVILISHAHFDHLDRPTLSRLARKEMVVITAKGTKRLIPRGFGRVIELGWHESVDVRRTTFTAYQPKHWGARTVVDRHRGYNAYVIETKRERVLFAGDTAFTHAFDGIAADLAIFGIGSYDPWEHAHATPEQVWAMFSAMRCGKLLPMHHSTFQLGEERPGEPMERLLLCAGMERERIVTEGLGRVVVLGADATKRRSDGATEGE